MTTNTLGNVYGMERRRYPRVDVRFPVVYRSAHRTVDAYTCNLSQGGLAISSPEIDNMGTECQVSLDLPGSQGPLTLSCRIVWIDVNHETPLIGFSFEELSREERAMLCNFLLARFQNP